MVSGTSNALNAITVCGSRIRTRRQIRTRRPSQSIRFAGQYRRVDAFVIAQGRAEIGHWEGDLIICKRTRPVLVLHERKSRASHHNPRPELNPVENIWLFLREHWLSSRVFASYRDLVDHCCDAWNRLTDQPWLIMSIGLRDWANA